MNTIKSVKLKVRLTGGTNLGQKQKYKDDFGTMNTLGTKWGHQANNRDDFWHYP